MVDLFGAGAIGGRLDARRPKAPDRPDHVFINVYANEPMAPGFDPLLNESRREADSRAEMAGMLGGVRSGLIRVTPKGPSAQVPDFGSGKMAIWRPDHG